MRNIAFASWCCLICASLWAKDVDLVVFDFPVDTGQVVNEFDLGGATPGGTGLVVFHSDTNEIEWMITYEGLTAPATAMHFHGPAQAGEAAGVDFGIDEFGESSSSGRGVLTEEQADRLLEGLWYLNIHTTANPAGEIRGQVVTLPELPVFDFPLTAAQNVHEIDLGEATPGGAAVVTFDAEESVLKWIINYRGLTGDPTAMHFHGPADFEEAAGVDLGIDEFGEDASFGSALVTAQQAADLKAGLWYLNIHTAANPKGRFGGK